MIRGIRSHLSGLAARASDLGTRARNGRRAVRVAWHDGARSRVSWLTSDHPDVLADEIQKARAMHRSTGVRVETEEREDDEIEVVERTARRASK